MSLMVISLQLYIILVFIDSGRASHIGAPASLRARKVHRKKEQKNASTPVDLSQHHADFVVVGAGTAGSLLAERLSKIGSVLILECGAELPVSVRSQLPGAGCTYDQLESEIGYNTDQQVCRNQCWEGMSQSTGLRHAPGLDFRLGPGGTSVIAVGAHFRGGDKYWSDIAKSHGQHWILPEDQLVKLENEMSVRTTPAAVDEDHVLFSQALSGEPNVFPRYQDESGWSTNSYTQFLKKAIEKSEVQIVTDACAQRLIKGDSTKPPVVEVQHQYQTYHVHARREVILAAGALGSPALLQRSGLSTAPLREQPTIRMAWPCKNCRYRKEFLIALQSFFQKQPATSPPGALTLPGYDSGTFVDLAGAPALIMAATTVGNGLSNMLPIVDKDKVGSMLVIHIVLLQPVSFEGSVDYAGQFHISQRLTHPKDLDAAVHGIRLVRKVITEQASLGQLGLGEEVFPGFKRQTDKDLKELLQSESSDAVALFQSATATCRLGKVVDGQMRVLGMHKTRVADASVLPKPPLGRTLFPTLRVAEIASKLIAQDGLQG